MAIKFGLVGFGTVSPYYLDAFCSYEGDAELVAVCDTNTSKKARIIQWGFDYCKTIEELVDNPKIEAVIIATPNYLHAEQAICSLKADKHVLIEKPMALNLTQAVRMVEIAKKQDKTLITGFHDRYHPSVQDLLKKRLKIKRIESVNSENILKHCSKENPWYLKRQFSGGGCVIDNGINFIDIFYELMGNSLKIKNVKLYHDKPELDTETRADIDFIFDEGTGNLRLDWTGEEIKSIVSDYFDNSTIITDLLETDKIQDGSSYMYDEYKFMLADFIQKIKEGKEFGQRGLEIQKLIEDIYSKQN